MPSSALKNKSGRTGAQVRETVDALRTQSSRRGQVVGLLRGGRVRWRIHRTKHPVILLLSPIWAGSVDPGDDLLRDPARDRAFISPIRTNCPEDRPVADDGLLPHPLERLADRGRVRADAFDGRSPP